MSRSRTHVIGIATAIAAIVLSGSARAVLVDHYEFENNGVDSAGGNANGTVGSNVSFGSGEIGQAAVFGTLFYVSNPNYRINVPQANAFAPGTGDFTIAFWVKRTQADTGNFDGVFDSLQSGTVGYQAYFNNSGQLVIRLDDDTGAWLDVVSTSTITDTTGFHHIAFTVDRTAGLGRWYFDGVADPAIDVSVLIGSIAPSHDLRIGGVNGGSSRWGLDGRLDDLRFYDHRLTAAEVQNLYSPVTAVCGNGLIEGAEACDDGNAADGDGCSSSCNVEAGYDCAGEPSVCTDIDECLSAPCDPNAACTNLPGSFTCECNAGYVGDGFACVLMDLIDHYEFEGGGVDSAGGDANGAAGANVSFAPGVLGQGAVFGVAASPASQRIDVPQANGFNPGTGDFSVAFWVKRDQNDTGNFDGVLDALNGGGTGYQIYFSNDANAGGGNLDKLFMRLDDDTGAWLNVVSATAFADTISFHHYALTVDRTADTAQIWADGVLDATVDISVLTSAIVPNQDLRIGAIGEGGLDGKLDDLRFYNYKLTAAELQGLMPGACCDDSTGDCTLELEADCNAVGFRYGGAGTDCTTIDPPCEAPAVCGNGVVEGTEECDDGNTTADGNCCSADCMFEAEFTACGDADATGCNAADTCDAAGSCVDRIKPDAHVCRAAAGDCDVAESCDGVNPDCPADVLLTTECRAAAGDCDIAESCDGANPDCPADVLLTTECRAAAGACDVAESCDGASPDCPADVLLTTECRAAAGACDIAESCDGANPDCPADLLLTTECRAAAGVCDIAESCDGADPDCPADVLLTTECRAAAGDCDVAESCDGVNPDCPADVLLTTECRAAAGECDIAESCDGADPDCPTDAKSTDVCRASTGVCDPLEACDGVGDDCPIDEFEPELTACGDPDDTDCNAPDSCDAAGSCVDRAKPDTYECRTAGGECDVEEYCDGATHACPVDGFEPEFTACGDPDDTDCNAPDSCDGAGGCVDHVKPDTHVCRAEAGECDIEELCDGSTYDCPVDDKSIDVCRASTGTCDPLEACDGLGDACPADTTIDDCIDHDGCCADGCNANDDSDCIPICGNGVQEEGEECDDGNDDETDACTSACTSRQPVPTVSTWGLVVLALLLLVGAKALSFGRRSRAV